MINKIKYGVLILAAGNSKRMHSVKSFLKFDSERCFIEKILDEYLEFGCKKIILIAQPKHSEWKDIQKKYNNTKLEIIFNNNIEFERFYSIKLGNQKADNLDYYFIQNSDNPFVNQNVLKQLANANSIYNNRLGDSDYKYYVPTFKQKGGHPILIGKEIMNKINSFKNDGNLKDLLINYKRINIEFDHENILLNINTVQQYLELYEKVLVNA